MENTVDTRLMQVNRTGGMDYLTIELAISMNLDYPNHLQTTASGLFFFRLSTKLGRLTTKKFYEARLPPGMHSPNWELIWNCRAPLKVKLFAWLLVRNRLSTKGNLLKKTIVQDGKCDICNQEEETANHMCFSCPFAQAFWAMINVQPQVQDVRHFHRLGPSSRVPALHCQVFFLLCMWAIWNHRHDVVFREKSSSI